VKKIYEGSSDACCWKKRPSGTRVFPRKRRKFGAGLCLEKAVFFG
jgi:hypothetical protein